MESYYEINVARDGKHLFATAPRSLPVNNFATANYLYDDFVRRFPALDGYEVEMCCYEIIGHRVCSTR